jgi:hypothetical protein
MRKHAPWRRHGERSEAIQEPANFIRAQAFGVAAADRLDGFAALAMTA